MLYTNRQHPIVKNRGEIKKVKENSFMSKLYF